MKRNTSQKSLGDLVQAPAYPHTGPQLFQQLRSALGETVGFQPTFPYLAGVIGENANVTFYWFNVMPQAQLIAFLSVLERLPENKRQAIINHFCRELPVFDNQRLAHDPIGVSNLERLLSVSNGMSWILGGTEFQQTFLIAAFGHSFSRATGGRQTIAGVDIHEPRRWVPLENVIYIREPLSPARVKKAVLDAWPVARSAQARVLLLNGIWSVAPDLHGEILEEAKNRHVIVTAPKIPEPDELKGVVKGPIHVLTISQPRENEKWIRFKVGVL